AMASSGIHSNGYSLVRKVLSVAGWEYEREVAELGRTLGEELLEPTRIYTADCLDLIEAFPVNGEDGQTGSGVRGFSHVTGGGLAANLARVLPVGTVGVVERSTWEIPAIFKLIGELGSVPQADLERTLNLGVGMIAVVDPSVADAAVERLNK
ncbi:AIR synthase-related protein, partial [Enterococcus faecium]